MGGTDGLTNRPGEAFYNNNIDEDDIFAEIDLVEGDPSPPEHEHPNDGVGGAAHGRLLVAVPPPDPGTQHFRRFKNISFIPRVSRLIA